MKIISFLVIVFIASISVAQDMKTGFQLLETGEYVKARDFFEEILKEYPQTRPLVYVMVER